MAGSTLCFKNTGDTIITLKNPLINDVPAYETAPHWKGPWAAGEKTITLDPSQAVYLRGTATPNIVRVVNDGTDETLEVYGGELVYDWFGLRDLSECDKISIVDNLDGLITKEKYVDAGAQETIIEGEKWYYSYAGIFGIPFEDAEAGERIVCQIDDSTVKSTVRTYPAKLMHGFCGCKNLHTNFGLGLGYQNEFAAYCYKGTYAFCFEGIQDRFCVYAGEVIYDNVVGRAETVGTESFAQLFYGSAIHNVFRDALSFDIVYDDTGVKKRQFAQCFMNSSLVEPVYLPTKKVNKECYAEFYCGCSNLDVVGDDFLGITEWGNDNDEECTGMFKDCENLKDFGVLFESWGTGHTTDWVSGTPATGIFRCPTGLMDVRSDSAIPTGWTIRNPGEFIDCFYIKNTGENDITITNPVDPDDDKILHWSFDEGSSWNQRADTITIPAGAKCYLKGTKTHIAHFWHWGGDAGGTSKPTYVWYDPLKLQNLTENDSIEIGGSLQSLLHDGDGSNLSPVTYVIEDGKRYCYSFYFLFGTNPEEDWPSPVTKCYIDFDNLIFSDRLLVAFQYFGLFSGASNLKSSFKEGFLGSPRVIAPKCYAWMFYDSIRREKFNMPKVFAPDVDICAFVGGYSFGSFLRSIAVQTVDVDILPFIDLTHGTEHYQNLFSSDHYLEHVIKLKAQHISKASYDELYSYCSSITVLPDGYFELEDWPEEKGAWGMFNECSNLSEMHVNLSTWLSPNGEDEAHEEWVEGVTANGKFYSQSWGVEPNTKKNLLSATKSGSNEGEGGGLPIIYDSSHIPYGWTFIEEGEDPPVPPTTRSAVSITFLGNIHVG